MPAGAGGQGYGIGAPGPGAVGKAAGQGGVGTGVSFPAGGGGGVSVGGGPMGAAITGAASLFPGGAQMAAISARTIEFGAQAIGIGVSGAIETFLPAGSQRAANGWFAKLAGGLSGAKPAKPNSAGGQGGQPQQAPAMAGAAGGAPGAAGGGDTNITVNNQRATEDGTGRDIDYHLRAQNTGPGW